jgi:hypothetical protein
LGSQMGAARQQLQVGSIYWNSTAPGSKCRRDWLVHQYSNVREECWWWNAGLLLRRTVVAVVFARRNLVDNRGGTQFNAAVGVSADWRVCIVVILCVQLFVSGYYDPYRFAGTNTFNDLSLYLLIVLYVAHMMEETNFFLILGLMSLFFLCLSLGLVLLAKSQTVNGWQRARVAALATSISPSFLDRRERRLRNVVVPDPDNIQSNLRENEAHVAEDPSVLSRLQQLEPIGATLPPLPIAMGADPESGAEQ